MYTRSYQRRRTASVFFGRNFLVLIKSSNNTFSIMVEISAFVKLSRAKGTVSLTSFDAQ
jgi:hypothetical protein